MVLHMWESGPLCQGLLSGKRTRGIWYRLEVPLKTASPLCSYNVHSLYYSHDVNSLVVAAIRTQGSIMTGIVESKLVKTMIDQSH